MSNTDDCTLQTCPLSAAYIQYQPNMAGNIFYLALFAIILIGQIGTGIVFRSWSFTVPMVAGLILEIIGYLGRILLHDNPFSFNDFLMYLICLTIAPAFFAAGIYLCLGRIITVYGEEFSRLKPRTYTYLFVTCDLISLTLQAAGGAITSIADEQSLHDTGVNIMIAGLVFQVASLVVFSILAIEYGVRVLRGRRLHSPTQKRPASWMRRSFLLGLTTAVSTILIRSSFRVAELQGGFDSKLANDETALMILEGAMVSIACICLTGLHPGLLVGKNWRTPKAIARDLEMED
ncbi:unnamed protein product [Penicillium nalgiovense]|uniref:RTA1 domain protein n=1 Tax=Penicillium nalgiovense TaxID=60175 RepID=A0A9W4I1Y3_PENNA|nr:unnamed protein product [Penicillium nalgiovense]CAG8003004.1 unnamed protein product [Penicillium nalgiovense]CAG8089987.1 unnamed protein product [Penicillium nalgiovense]CAG8108948.1 unnamed protein product [Penicillium nalgiovense]CAG8110274.1 unnamed protein product [Penicillium nalgiovense]